MRCKDSTRERKREKSTAHDLRTESRNHEINKKVLLENAFQTCVWLLGFRGENMGVEKPVLKDKKNEKKENFLLTSPFFGEK